MVRIMSRGKRDKMKTKLSVVMINKETKEIFVEAEMSETRIKAMAKSYEKAGFPVTVVYGKAA